MILRAFALALIAGVALCSLPVVADPGPAALESLYHVLEPAFAESPFELPLVVQATLDDRQVRGDVYAEIARPFEMLARELSSVDAWCDVVTLHFNMKSCSRLQPSRVGAQGVGIPLSIETARKVYVPPQGRKPMTYWLDGSGTRSGFLHQRLTAAKGPLGVRDIRIEFEAIALEGGDTFVHLHYAYRAGWAARFATRTYLATLGRKKVGFTIVGRSADGEPVYVRGEEAAVERNALRYHLAIAAYLDTLAVPEPDRFEARIARWFDLSARHSAQLFEMPREKYLEIKRRERRDQEVALAARASTPWR
jgi:hypothetical protein